jgi:hypothetical protein
MRFLVTATLPTKTANEAMQNGTFGPIFEKYLAEIKPEAVYFTEAEGHRTIIIVVNLVTANEIIKVSEPLFHAFKAAIDWKLIMSPDEVLSGLHYMQCAVKSYTHEARAA